MMIYGSAQIGKGDVFVNLNTKFNLCTCVFTSTNAWRPISMIIAYPNVTDTDHKIRTCVVEELGFKDQADYINSYPGRSIEGVMDIQISNLSERSYGNKILKLSLNQDFKKGAFQLISTPKMSGVTLCTCFKNLGYDNLWYCNDWEG